VNYDDWKTSPPDPDRDPSVEEFDDAVDEIIEEEDLTELVKKDPVLRRRFIYLRRMRIDAAAVEKRDLALVAEEEEDYCDDEDGDS